MKIIIYNNLEETPTKIKLDLDVFKILIQIG